MSEGNEVEDEVGVHSNRAIGSPTPRRVFTRTVNSPFRLQSAQSCARVPDSGQRDCARGTRHSRTHLVLRTLELVPEDLLVSLRLCTRLGEPAAHRRVG